MSGADTQYAVGVYGTQDVAAGANVPGARYSAVSWIDSRNNLWLFGEISYDPALVEYPFLYDVWKFRCSNQNVDLDAATWAPRLRHQNSSLLMRKLPTNSNCRFSQSA